ncbi:hypothetical protein F53441_4719 [Fusarium austroafricanum]|uniref:Uncharacterized protein n=1 Tax=Fusarium austroafricanum TaxID=2364996 RepID=A0A8H4KNA2_9HYPO|nr:hypothetical protein F53441_4719 [Fusarium austroafricanum]
MCLEKVTIAMCAPKEAPYLSFDCGKLHLVAADRIVCDKARAKCVCYFGTCGTVERELPTKGIDITSLAKVRCVECTPREDNVGNRRTSQEILESPLLQRAAVDEAAWPKQAELLRGLWRGKSGCPYHVGALNTINGAPVLQHAQVEVGTHSVVEPTVSKPVAAKEEDFIEFSSTEHDTSNVANSEHVPVESGPVESPIAEPAAVVDEWVSDAPVSYHGDGEVHEFEFNSRIKNGLETEVGISTSRWAPEKSPEKSLETSDVKDQGQFQVQEPVTTGPRRVPTVNFSFDPNNAEKIRDTTQKFADLKASFLMATS